MKTDFTKGDVVKHKAGKRKMVVLETDYDSDDDKEVLCRWETKDHFTSLWFRKCEIFKLRGKKNAT